MNTTSTIAGIGILLVVAILLRQSLGGGFQSQIHGVLTRDPPIVGHPHYGRPETP